MILQACLNGSRRPGDHPALPITPTALASDALTAVRRGANEVHLHVRGDDGKETLHYAALDETLKFVRLAVPGTLIGVSTGAWIEGDPGRTLDQIANWRALPDHASVNLSEPATPDMIKLLRRLGVGIEAGLASVADAELLLALNVGPACLRILVELDREKTTVEASAAADAMLAALAKAHWRKPILVHGFDATVWPMLEYATRKSYSARIGLEDGLTLPDGSIAEGNGALVQAARREIDRILAI